MTENSSTAGTIAVDAMGGDLGPAEVVAAVKLAIEQFPQLRPITLVGDEAQLRSHLKESGLALGPRLSIRHASEVIVMEDGIQALRRKKDASMLRALELVKDGAAAAVLSTGNTKILVAAGTVKLRTFNGVERPALAPVIPRENGNMILIDAGANPEATAEHLVHNAIMGSHLCRVNLEVRNPRVGLLTIGTEEGKGNALITEAHEALKRIGGIVNYVGPIEGFQVFKDTVDVVVCDGFTGNICLKTWESLVKFFKAEMKSYMQANPLRTAGAILAKGAFKDLKARLEPDRYGGAQLLGLRGCVVKCHGSANRRALANGLGDASRFLELDLNHRIEADVAKANELIRQTAA